MILQKKIDFRQFYNTDEISFLIIKKQQLLENALINEYHKLVLIMPKMNGHLITFKVKYGDKDKNNLKQ